MKRIIHAFAHLLHVNRCEIKYLPAFWRGPGFVQRRCVTCGVTSIESED